MAEINGAGGIRTDKISAHHIVHRTAVCEENAESIGPDYIGRRCSCTAHDIANGAELNLDPIEAIAKRDHTCHIHADIIALHHVAVTPGIRDFNGVNVITGNNVAICCGDAANRISGRSAANLNAPAAITQIGRAADIGADVIPSDGIVVGGIELNPVSAKAVDHQASNRTAGAAARET